MEFLGTVIAIAFIAVIVFLMSKSRNSTSNDGQPSPGPGPGPIDPIPQPPEQIRSVLTREELESMTKAQLVAEGAKYGVQLKQSSKKADLVEAVSKAIKQK